MAKKCKYYREDEITQYTPECTGNTTGVHPQDIKGDYCQYCGKKIKFKEWTTVPKHILHTEDF